MVTLCKLNFVGSRNFRTKVLNPQRDCKFKIRCSIGSSSNSNVKEGWDSTRTELNQITKLEKSVYNITSNKVIHVIHSNLIITWQYKKRGPSAGPGQDWTRRRSNIAVTDTSWDRWQEVHRALSLLHPMSFVQSTEWRLVRTPPSGQRRLKDSSSNQGLHLICAIHPDPEVIITNYYHYNKQYDVIDN